ncbi:hypothetical protein EPN42_08170 [bacterium]|nr:MAG: hypothetical protein EPN42_08170 [bacterium]TAM95433.1 MAG: hypothetical protein EPN45_22890 [Rhizobiaceae bacterium]
MTAVNQDSLPHSLEIISAQQTPPMQGIQPPIFAGATTADLIGGLASNQSDTFAFTASAPGRFWMMCGVPGHAAGGMWDWFVVSPTATKPSVAYGP